MNNTIEYYTFPNGLRLVHKTVTHTQIAHCGFILNIGSRDEKMTEQGLAHFWEHMAFKGTKKRSSFHILNRLESVGGEINAYTTKEKICFYASFLEKHYERAFELLTDITFEPTFPTHQIETERGVILEEMAMYLDSPDDNLQDEFDGLIFKNHSLGYNILGTTESVSGFKQIDFQNFFQQNISTNEIVFASVSPQPFSKVKKLAEKYLANIPTQYNEKKRTPFYHYQAENITKFHHATQAHCAIGSEAYSLQDEKRLPFFILCNILGGPALNSRLNWSLREKNGLVYSVDANFQPYTDTGLFAVYFATEAKQIDKSLHLVLKELKNLRTQKLTSVQLHKAKEQVLGQLAMAEESNQSFMLMMGKSLLDNGKIENIEDIFTQIRQLSAEQLLEVANEIWDENRLSILKYLPQ
ncbi:MAG: insulinase family protein [Bacteroidetes bacterium]|nr:MAG: insulinase family protein [Bacteroidota bacterium]